MPEAVGENLCGTRPEALVCDWRVEWTLFWSGSDLAKGLSFLRESVSGDRVVVRSWQLSSSISTSNLLSFVWNSAEV